MNKPRRYNINEWIFEYESSPMEPHPEGEWITYSDHKKVLEHFAEELILNWNYNLSHGGALNETSSKEGE